MIRRIAGVLAVTLSAAASADAATCTVSTTPVMFGSYSVYSVTATDSVGTITYRCTGPGQADITISISQGQSGSFTPRQMANGSEQLNYNLYRNAARTNIWGDGSGTTRVFTRNNVPNNQNFNLNVFGRIPAAQDVAAGGYADNVVVTVNF